MWARRGAIIILLCSVNIACSPASEQGAQLDVSELTQGGSRTAPAKPDGLIYCSESSPSSFNPQLDTSSTTVDATAHQLYNRLLEFEPHTGKLIPSLASSWRISRDGLRYTFQLRPNIAFHSTEYFAPTRALNADDVMFSFNRWLDPNHPFHEVNGGAYPYFDSLNLPQTIKAITKVNTHRVQIELHQPDSSFITNIASDFANILSAEYGQAMLNAGTPEHIDFYPIGTGPFQFAYYRKNQYIRFEAHEQYWQANRHNQQLIFDITPQSSMRLAKLLTGECDTIAYPSQAEINYVQDNPAIALQQAPGLNVGFWAFNTGKAPFDDVRVRRALAYAIDKTTIIDAVYFNSASRARTIVPPSSWAYSPDMQEPSYNPMRARELLTEAGYPNGFRMTVWAMPLVRAYNPDALRMAELIKGYLSNVGIRVDIVTSDWERFRAGLNRGDHDSVLIGWSADNGDPDNFYRPLLTCSAMSSGTNRAMFCNDEYDRLINKAVLTANVTERRAFYQQANELIARELPLLPIAHANRYQVYRSDLQGIAINPYGGMQFKNVFREQP